MLLFSEMLLLCVSEPVEVSSGAQKCPFIAQRLSSTASATSASGEVLDLATAAQAAIRGTSGEQPTWGA